MEFDLHVGKVFVSVCRQPTSQPGNSDTEQQHQQLFLSFGGFRFHKRPFLETCLLRRNISGMMLEKRPCVSSESRAVDLQEEGIIITGDLPKLPASQAHQATSKVQQCRQHARPTPLIHQSTQASID
jgi:hypothetical protein